jgi:hypothetical protein
MADPKLYASAATRATPPIRRRVLAFGLRTGGAVTYQLALHGEQRMLVPSTATGEDSGMDAQRDRSVRVRWIRIDRALAPFTASSVIPLLSAAIDSRFLGAVRPQLWLVWTRALRRPPAGMRPAGPADLHGLVMGGLAADPRPPLVLREPADPRTLVRYSCGGARLRVHPGELEHPLLFLRSTSMVAAAIDPYLISRIGFGLNDVLELTLRAGDCYLSQLSPAWLPGEPPDWGADEGIQVDRIVTEAEVAAAERALQAVSLPDLADSCANPAQAALALQWLSRRSLDLRVTMAPGGLSLGSVLAVAASQGTVLMPAALIPETLLAASARLATRAAGDKGSRQALRAFTAYRAEELLQGPARITNTGPSASSRPPGEGAVVDAEVGAGDFPVFVGATFSGVITSYLDPREFGPAIHQARESAHTITADAARMAGQRLLPDVPRVVVYGGLALLAEAVPHDIVHLHVEELAEMMTDAAGDMDMITQFLREISSHPGASDLLFVDVLDVWWHWREQKIIGPLFPEAGVVAVLPYESRPDWDRAGIWEPIEEVLAGAGMPPCARWPVVRLDEPGQATLPLPPPNRPGVVLVRADPPLLVIVSFDDGTALGINPDGMYGLADGVRITAGRHQGIADFLRLPDGAPLTCVIKLTTERQPPQPEADITGIGVATDPERHCISMQLGPEFFERLTETPAQAHEMLGWALHHAVTALRAPQDEDPGVSAAAFLTAWKATPPVMMISRFENVTPAAVPRDPLPQGQFARARALRAVAIELQDARQPSRILGERAMLARVVGVTEALLRRRLGGCDPAVIADMAGALNAAHANHWRYRHELNFALSAPWAGDWQAAAIEGEDPTARLRPLELLLEFFVLTPPDGDHRPDRHEITELEQLAHVLLENRTRLNAMDVGLGYTTLDEVPDMPSQEDEPLPAADTRDDPAMNLNFGAYAEASARDRIRIRTPTPDSIAASPARPSHGTSGEFKTARPPGERMANDFRPIASLDAPPHMMSADALMRAHLGTGLDGIRAVLGTAVDWTANAEVAVTDPESLAQAAEDWSGLPRPEIDAAVILLSLDALNSHDEVHRYWEVERRSHRLRMRPFPVIGGKVWIMPWAAAATQELFSIYFQDSRLPYSDPALPPAAATAMQQHRQRRNLQLEAEVGATVQRLGLPYRLRWKPEDAQIAGLTNLPGEIDLIVADAATNRLWVCEIKDPEAAFAPAAMRRHIERFVRNSGHVKKLLAKANAVSGNPAAAANACGIQNQKTWHVIPLMVTRRIEPTAFLDNPQVAFTVLEDLPAVLRAEPDPAPGQVQIGE